MPTALANQHHENYTLSLSRRINDTWYIYLHLLLKNQPNVAKYAFLR